MFIVSFYSYKGGVGRTLALLNIAWYLAKKGRRLALVDMDMEAPGLQQARLLRRISQTGEKSDWEAPHIKGGLKELITASIEQSSMDDTKFKDNFTRGLGPGGLITLLAAGGDVNSTEYQSFIHSFSWKNFYREEHGRSFMEKLVELFERSGYDYLFLDARTGLTDVAGITTLHLPDLVVAITNLSDQSAYGIKNVLESIDSVNEECHSPEGSLFRRRTKKHIPIETLLVLAPFPVGEYGALDERISKVESIIGRPIDAGISYLPLLALGEESQIVYQELDVGPIKSLQLQFNAAQDYEELAENIISRNPEAIENLTKIGIQLINIGRWREALPYVLAVSNVEKKRNRYGSAFWEAAVSSIRAQAQSLDPEQATKVLEDLEQKLKDFPLAPPGQLSGTGEGETAKDELQRSICEAFKKAQESGAELSILSPQKRARHLLDGQLALSWTYTLLNEPQEAFRLSKKSSKILKDMVEDEDCEEFLGELKPLLGFSLWHTGRTASDADDLQMASKYYKEAQKIYKEVRSRPFESFLCALDQAYITLYTENVNAANQLIKEAYDLKKAFTYKVDYVEACYNQRLAQHKLAVGEIDEAWEYFDDAEKGFKGESDRVGLNEVFAEKYRMVVLFGYRPPKEISDNTVEKHIDEMDILRLEDLALELKRLYIINKALSRDMVGDKSYDSLDEKDSRLFPNQEDDLSFSLLKSYFYLVTGEIDQAHDELNRMPNIGEFKSDGPLSQRLRHEWHLLNGLTSFAVGKSMEETKTLEEHLVDRNDKGYRLEALQSLSIYSLFQAISNNSTWETQLKKAMQELEVYKFAKDGRWSAFTYGLGKSDAYLEQLDKVNRREIFEKLLDIIKTN